MGATEQPPDLGQIAERIAGAASDAAAVTVGLGILGINRLQVLRRQAQARLVAIGRTGPTSPDGG